MALAQMGGTEAFINQSDAIWQLRGVAKGAGRAISLRFFAARVSVRYPVGVVGKKRRDRTRFQIWAL